MFCGDAKTNPESLMGTMAGRRPAPVEIAVVVVEATDAGHDTTLGVAFADASAAGAGLAGAESVVTGAG